MQSFTYFKRKTKEEEEPWVVEHLQIYVILNSTLFSLGRILVLMSDMGHLRKQI